MGDGTWIAPDWINREYLQNVLRSFYKDVDLRVTNYDVTPATTTGENYCSEIFRAKLRTITMTGQSNDSSIILKTNPRRFAAKSVNEWSIFEEEVFTLTKILPNINRILQNVDQNMDPLHATCIWTGCEPENSIIMEDLCDKGYSTIDRVNGLDLKHAKAALEALGKFHAASYSLLQSNPELFANFYKKRMHETFDFNLRCLSILLDEVIIWENFPEDYLMKLRSIDAETMRKAQITSAMNENTFNTFIHGDFWTNNILFRRDPDEQLRVKFVDFQICQVNSPALDLVNFIFTSLDYSIMTGEIDALLLIYYNSLMGTLNDLKVTLRSPFSFENLKSDFTDRLWCGVTNFLFIYPFSVVEPENAPTMGEIYKGEGFKKLYQSAKFREALPVVLPYFIKNKLFS